MLYRFANFELDQQRAELRGADGQPIRLRRKSFDLLVLLASNPGRILAKQELTGAIWPNIHVGEDSLFQCIREIRTALSDDERRLIKVVPGRGYLLDAEVSTETVGGGAAARGSRRPDPERHDTPATGPSRRRFVLRWRMAGAAAAAAAIMLGLAIATPLMAPNLFRRQPPSVAVAPITVSDNDIEVARMADRVTERITDGLATVDNIVVVLPSAPANASRAAPAFVIKGDLDRSSAAWTLRVRLVIAATGEVRSLPPVSVAVADNDRGLQQTRLAAGAGHLVAKELNSLLHPAYARASSRETRGSGGKAAIAQAMAFINRTSRERFADAETILEKAVADDDGDINVKIALAALKLRGIQMVWYSPAQRVAAERDVSRVLDSAMRAAPHFLPLVEARCRFLTATNQFVDALVACDQALDLDPWDGIALYHIGLTQVQLGRFNDALQTFKEADRYNTPEVSRWTWMLGAGIATLMMDRADEAVSWLNRSIAITPASGRSYMVLAAAYQRLGRTDEAKAAMAKGLALRPHSTTANVTLPLQNTSPVYRAALVPVLDAMVAAGLPPGDRVSSLP